MRLQINVSSSGEELGPVELGGERAREANAHLNHRWRETSPAGAPCHLFLQRSRAVDIPHSIQVSREALPEGVSELRPGVAVTL